MVHRGWHKHQVPHGLSEAVFRLDSNSGTSKDTMGSEKKNSPRKSKPAIQEFAFVNATTPFRNRDPEVRRLVRGHVVKDTTRKKKLWRENERPKISISVKPESKDEVQESCSSLKTRQPSVVPEEMTLANLPKGYYSKLPYKEMDPHHELSPIIHHIAEMGYAMCPHLVSFRINPTGPTAWFDHALRDEAMFHALLYTAMSYAGLIGGSMETKESIAHSWEDVSLVKERLKSMCDVSNGTVVTVLVEETARAVSCLAFTEVSFVSVELARWSLTASRRSFEEILRDGKHI
jgi:hypothetical protein